ncbi:MAG: hypothetical protein M1504_03125 [Candidatus Marsarchaeota archaeon]|nr:hypothetical protein [Candidatus Marsarchaeota archaeon]
MNEIVPYVAISTSLLSALASLATLNPILIALTATLSFASLFVYKLWYVVEAVLFKHTNIIQVFDGYELSDDRLSAMRHVGGSASATAAAIIYAGKGDIDKSKLENIITHVNFPFKFSMQVEMLPLEKLVNRLQTKRSEKEIALSRMGSNASNLVRINQLKREIEQIEKDIKSITTGETPLRIAYYIFATAVADSTYGAQERAISRIRELSSQFDAVLGSRSKQIGGDELLHLLKIDSYMVY